jgi:hypothetical protein
MHVGDGEPGFQWKGSAVWLQPVLGRAGIAPPLSASHVAKAGSTPTLRAELSVGARTLHLDCGNEKGAKEEDRRDRLQPVDWIGTRLAPGGSVLTCRCAADWRSAVRCWRRRAERAIGRSRWSCRCPRPQSGWATPVCRSGQVDHRSLTGLAAGKDHRHEAIVRAHNFAPDGPQHPAQTLVRTAVRCPYSHGGSQGVRSPHLHTAETVGQAATRGGL